MKQQQRRAFLATLSKAAALPLLTMAPLGSVLASKKAIKAAVIFSIPNPGSAAGWDGGSWAGVQSLIKTHGWDVTVAEAVPFPRLASTAENYAKSGFDVVIFTSSGHIGAWKQVAPKYPNTLFAMMSVTPELPPGDNVQAYSLDLYSYGVVGGIVAGTATKTNKIAAVAGAPIPSLMTWMSGIIEGAKAVRPDVEVLTAFSGDWVDVPRAREVTAMQLGRGADIIVMNAGAATRGVLDAVESANALSVGYATDLHSESPKAILTSVIMNIPQWYEDLAKAVDAGDTKPHLKVYGPQSFSLADMRGKGADGLEQEIMAAFRRYQQGELKVPVVAHQVK